MRCSGIKAGWFAKASGKFSKSLGSPNSFLLAFLAILGWVLTGPIFHYSETWQLFINTATSIVTFLFVFLIQNTQNRDALAVQLKLNELIRSTGAARNSLIGIKDMSQEELAELKIEFENLRARAVTKEETPKPTLPPGL